MSSTPVVVWLDGRQAVILHLLHDGVQASRLHVHEHATAQHGSGVRSEHEFHADVCGALEGVSEALVTGSHMALANLRHYVEKHRPRVQARIAGYETVGNLTDHELAALGRKFFEQRAQGLASGR
jgi:hypothetical protein